MTKGERPSPGTGKGARECVDLVPVETGPAPAARAGLFLGRLDPAALSAELEEASLLEVLAGRGYPLVSVRASLEGGVHRLRLLAPGVAPPLLDLRASESSFLLAAPPRLRLRLEVFSFLVVRGLVLQDPRRDFTAQRPRLPGQEHPGLGALGRVLDRLLRWAEDWGKDGLVAIPPSYHAAVMLDRGFGFLSGERQGRFQALRRDAGARPLADASWAVAEGRVVDGAEARFRWEPAEIAAPLAGDLRCHLASPDYRDAAAAVRDRASYRFSPPQASQGQSPRSSRKL